MPSNDKSVPRILQQQSEQDSDREQQRSGGGSQPHAAGSKDGDKDIGEGSYEATRDYQKNIKEYLKDADVDHDAEAAKPRSEQEKRDMEQAEQEGRSHSKGER